MAQVTAAPQPLSLWWDTLPAHLAAADRPPLGDDLSVDVCIVGAGYTGLWTAYYLQQADSSLSIAILDANVAGFGASGRNGGWCSSYFPTEIDKLSRVHGREAAKAMQDAMHATVDEVHRVTVTEGLDCDWQLGGSITLARTPLQWKRAQEYIAHLRAWGYGDEHYRLLSAAEATDMAMATGTLGATWSAHVAAINPAKLVRGLANLVESRGARIFEHTRVTAIDSGMARTDHGTVTAGVVVRATEGYTPSLAGHRRDIAPIYSLMLATEPLDEATWDRIGLANRATFSDWRNLIIYGQRTADGRIAFGGRGAPYHFASTIRPDFDRDANVHDGLVAVLTDMFPTLAGTRITHRWGGPLGVPRDWMASVGRHGSYAWAGGYVGDGVGTTNLAGRTLAQLITDQRSELTALPWVDHQSPKWEPEPLRWIGANLGLRTMTWADAIEDRTGRPSRLGAAMYKLLGQ